VAQRLTVQLATLADWRFRGVGPPFVKVGKLVRYPLDALDAWIAARLVTPTAAIADDARA
jgi:hypothetical protein